MCCFLVLSGCEKEEEGPAVGLSAEEKARQEECEKKSSGWLWDMMKKECIVAPKTEEDCTVKGEGWLWDMMKKECIVAPKTEEDCTVKGEGWLWDVVKKECKAPPAPNLSNKEKCEAKGEGWFWHAIQPTDPGEEYKKCFKDLAVDCKDPAKPVVKKASPLECVAPHIIIISDRWRWLEIDPPGIGRYGNRSDANRGIILTGHNRCWVMDKKTVDGYRPFFVNSYKNDEAYGEGLKDKKIVVCGRMRGSNRNPCPTVKGIYKAHVDARFGSYLRKVTRTVEELRELGCFERIISADGPL